MVESLKKGYDAFLIKEISKYIAQELRTGKDLVSIKKALLDAGHDKNAIEIAILEMEKHNFESFSTKKIENEAEKKIIDALEVFIEDRLRHGVGIEKIKKVLKEYGHSDALIEKALINVRYKPNRKEKKRGFLRPEALEKEHILLTGIISIILLITMSAAVTDESIFLVFIGFLPTTIAILIGYYYSDYLREKIFIAPFVICSLFFAMGLANTPVRNMEYGSLTVLNLVLSFIMMILFNEVGDKENKTMPPAKVPDKIDEKQVKKEKKGQEHKEKRRQAKKQTE